MCVLLGSMIRDLLNKLRRRESEIVRKLTPEALRALYNVLGKYRCFLVEAFDLVKNRRLREVYDSFSFMMLHYDKLFQLIRRIVGASLYDSSYKDVNVEEELSKLPIELAMRLRQIGSHISMLKQYAASASPSSIKLVVLDLDSMIEELARTIESVVR